MERLVDWSCRYGALTLSALVAIYLLHAAGLEFGEGLVQMLAQEGAILGIVAVGAMLVFYAGAFDLSLGAVFALALVMLALLMDAGYDSLAVGAVLAGGLLVGAFNGAVGLSLGAPVLMSAVLAVAWREAAVTVAGVYPVTPYSAAAQSLRALSWHTVTGVSLSFFIFIASAVALQRVLTHTAVGRQIVAAGLSDRRARLAGVPVPLYRVACYAAGGLAAAVGALAYFSLLSTGSPQVGSLLPFDVLAAIVIGNGGLHRGRPAPLRVAVAVVCLTAIHAGAPTALGAPWSALLVTVILMAAALLGQLRRPAAR